MAGCCIRPIAEINDCIPIDAHCAEYTGTDLACLGISGTDKLRIDEILQRIDTKICTLAFSLYTQDTNSVNLSTSGTGTLANPLTADVKVSADVDNVIEIRDDGLYSAPQIQFDIPVVDDIPALLGFDKDDSEIVFVKDHLRGGIFYYEASGTADDIVFFDELGGGVWRRDTSSTTDANATWAGAKSSLSSAANTAIIQAMIDAGYRNIYIDEGIIYLPDTLINRTDVLITDNRTQETIYGEGGRITFLNPIAVEPARTSYIQAISNAKGIHIVADNTIVDESQRPAFTISSTRVATRNVKFVLAHALGADADGNAIPKVDGATTIDISKGNSLGFADTTPTNFTEFLNGTPGQFIFCWFGSSNTTLIDSSVLKLGGTDINVPANKVLLFFIGTDGVAFLTGL